MDEFFDYFRQRKNLLNLLILIILLVALPLGINLIRQQQILRSKAAVDPIVFTGANVQKKTDGTFVATKPQITLDITSPLGPVVGQVAPLPSSTNPASTTPPGSNVIPDYSTFNVGFNATGITHYGYGDLLVYSSTRDVDMDLGEIQRMKGKIIRVFAANDNISSDEAAKRLDSFLNKAASYNITVIPVLINFYGDNGFRPQGTQQYYTDTWNNIPLLGHAFFAGDYQKEFLSFVRTVVGSNKNHSNIYAWEVGNELKDSSDPQVFINFMRDITGVIKGIDPGHKVATGMMNAGHTGLSAEALYPNLPNIDIVTIHTYDGSRAGMEDVGWATSQGKIVINEEMGFSGTGDRSSQLRQEIDFWKSQGVMAVLQWGFLGKGLPDNGNGDGTYGMDTVWHTDYDQLVDVFSSFN